MFDIRFSVVSSHFSQFLHHMLVHFLPPFYLFLITCTFYITSAFTKLMVLRALSSRYPPSLFECPQVVILAVLANPQSQLLVRDPSKTTNANQIRTFWTQKVILDDKKSRVFFSGSEEKETGVVYLLDNDKREDCSHLD